MLHRRHCVTVAIVLIPLLILYRSPRLPGGHLILSLHLSGILEQIETSTAKAFDRAQFGNLLLLFVAVLHVGAVAGVVVGDGEDVREDGA